MSWADEQDQSEYEAIGHKSLHTKSQIHNIVVSNISGGLLLLRTVIIIHLSQYVYARLLTQSTHVHTTHTGLLMILYARRKRHWFRLLRIRNNWQYNHIIRSKGQVVPMNSNHIRRTNKQTLQTDLFDCPILVSVCPFVVYVVSYGSSGSLTGHLPSDKSPLQLIAKWDTCPGHKPRSKTLLHTVNDYLFIYLDFDSGTTPISIHTNNIEHKQ